MLAKRIMVAASVLSRGKPLDRRFMNEPRKPD
jgi:hypothetical protein